MHWITHRHQLTKTTFNGILKQKIILYHVAYNILQQLRRLQKTVAPDGTSWSRHFNVAHSVICFFQHTLSPLFIGTITYAAILLYDSFRQPVRIIILDFNIIHIFSNKRNLLSMTCARQPLQKAKNAWRTAKLTATHADSSHSGHLLWLKNKSNWQKIFMINVQ